MNTVLQTTERGSLPVTLSIVLGDITEERVDAIVNAANSDLLHGGGVAGAIAAKGGPVINQESARIAPVPVGGAARTSGGDLPARWVIHAVGPRWGTDGVGEKADRALTKAVRSALDVAAAGKGEIRTLSLPAISLGIFGFPAERGSEVILRAILAWLAEHPDPPLDEIRICLFDRDLAQVFLDAWSTLELSSS